MKRLALPAALAVVAALAGFACDSEMTCEGEDGCGGTCSVGNDFGVGMYCTPGGGECADTPGRMAPFCTADQRPEADWFCTRPCDPDMPVEPQCGQDALCEDEGGGPSGCILAVCVN